MKQKRTPRPPKWATRLLECYCRPELLEDLQGDLNEFFERNLATRGLFVARLIYVIDVLKFFRRYTTRRPAITNPFSRKVIFASYFKTSGRAVMRNKLFSGINIVGMAISLSVGLLLVAFLSDLFSFDRTLKNKERIYRVVTTFSPSDHPPIKLASTSWKAGILIRQQIPGVEAVAVLFRGFGGDARIGDNTVPVTGLYADEGFFNVFSFPLEKGIAATALKEPHSLVLTRSAAKKLFGPADPMGRIVKVDTVNYTVTGVMPDVPKLSHVHFEMLASLSSIDLTTRNADGIYMGWGNVFSNYVYVLLSPHSDPAVFTAALNRMNDRENALAAGKNKIVLWPQRLGDIVVGRPMGNELGPTFSVIAVLVLCGLAAIILLSACFNYTNLSIARSLRRSREVGIRKVIGANRLQVIGQFIAESVIISLLSLFFAFFIFLLLRSQFLSLNENLEETFSLLLSPRLMLFFFLLAMAVGVIAGVLPAFFYSKINAVQVLKDASSLKVFRHLNLRKALVVTQYTFSLIFITATVIGYTQYRSFVQFDLGFSTKNILNVNLQGSDAGLFVKKLSVLPSVEGISQSLIISSLGSLYGTNVKYNSDSTGADINYIDAHYLSLHHYTFLAGRNFTAKPKNAPETETIVNQELIRHFNIGHNDPEKAIGQVVTIDDKQLTIVGVLKDFHYGTVESKIDPTAFRYSAEPGGYVNIKINPMDVPAAMTGIETIWKQIDKVHPLNAKFYDDQIVDAYHWLSMMLKIIGLFALIAVVISSLGLFGMVVYTMEKRVKEVSIRRVLGARTVNLVYLLNKSFLFLLLISALIALPLTWLFFQKVVLVNVAYHKPIRFSDIFTGLLVVALIAFAMIGVQTLRIVRANPARVLKNE